MKTEIMIELRSIDKVKEFINDINKMEGEFELISGRYKVDARSAIEIFCLDLSGPLQLISITEKADNAAELKKYIFK